MIRDDATETQVRAAIPDHSTWVEANAGSGKTRVLTDRVARLLLEGVQPQHILCLTYTKAAASEMQNRLFKRLGEWAMMDGGNLRKSLNKLGVEHQIDETYLRQSRRLFAQAIEAPGGLKIQTIHSFCSSLLRRFPREAGVSPQFTEIEERTAALLRQEVVDQMAMSDQKPLVDELARHYTGEDFEGLTYEVLKHPDAFNRGRDEIWTAFGLANGATKADAVKVAFEGSEAALWAELVSILEGQSASYQKIAANLKAIDPASPKPEDLSWLFKTFLFQSGDDKFKSKAGRWPQRNHKKAVEAVAPVQQALDAFMGRVEAAFDFINAVAAAEKTYALSGFANSFISLYSSRKQALGYLDFDDLILRARALLTDPAVAQWVLFRLDGGIDHILVDEAQDTSPVQWEVIERLAQEFTSGEGARADVTRTLFVVGDKKQSIYSFQGADPDAFDRMRDEFRKRLSDIGSRLHDVPMSFSFRSSPAILNMVDYTFHPGHHDAIGQEASHRAFHSDLPGRVDLWPQVEHVQDEDDKNWSDPIDLPGQKNHNVVLANAVADEIQRLLTSGETLPEKDSDTGVIFRRPIRAGDFMILVRGRTGGIFHQIIQACKVRGLPIAGADRLKVGAELAVRDLAALLSFLALQEDDLSLATALKSPLFGWSEQDLYTLAQGRGKRGLWQVLRDRAETHSDTVEILTDLRNHADFLRPFELIERVLTRHGGRLNLLGRLGQEAEDGIDALLAQALAYEQSNTPSLTGFLVWMQEDELEIKRQMDASGDLIRVMTVHGSKGLEAPIVILPQTTPPKADVRAEVFTPDGGAMWKTKADDMPAVMRSAKEALQKKQQDETMRLLYVAMTRAEKWLIVAGTEPKKNGGKSWYDIVAEGMDHAGAEACAFQLGQGRRYAVGDWVAGDVRSTEITSSALPDLPEWVAGDASRPAPHPETISPSRLEGAKALPSETGLDEEVAKAYGTAVHLLLEHLTVFPQALWQEKAALLLEQKGGVLSSGLKTQAAQEAMSVLSSTDLAPLFADDTLAEVSISADLPIGRIHGTIDRLIVTPTQVTAIDFKSNRATPFRAEETPKGLLRQMGAYAAALRQIYPSHEIRTEILWTATASRMPLPDILITEALETLDVP